MKKHITILILLIYCAFTPAQQANARAIVSHKYVQGIYRIPMPDKNGMKIWIVDGLVVRREIFAEFLYGGNPAPYLFIPKNEIWIDHAISAEEFESTLAHELNEYNLMKTKGMSYTNAHDSSLVLELSMRRNDSLLVQKHEKEIRKVPPTDCYGLKQIKELPDSVSLKDIYKQRYTTENGMEIWIVDGSRVRREIFPDFGFSGNDLAYNFIPRNEIWIDGQISCEETEISIKAELEERQLMQKGLSYDDAYSIVIGKIQKYRKDLYKISLKHPPVPIPSKLTREYSINKQ